MIATNPWGKSQYLRQGVKDAVITIILYATAVVLVPIAYVIFGWKDDSTQ